MMVVTLASFTTISGRDRSRHRQKCDLRTDPMAQPGRIMITTGSSISSWAKSKTCSTFPVINPQNPREDSLSTLRHELHTPMNHIIGYSEMLIDEAQDLDRPVFLPDLQRIHAAGKRLHVGREEGRLQVDHRRPVAQG